VVVLDQGHDVLVEVRYSGPQSWVLCKLYIFQLLLFVSKPKTTEDVWVCCVIIILRGLSSCGTTWQTILWYVCKLGTYHFCNSWLLLVSCLLWFVIDIVDDSASRYVTVYSLTLDAALPLPPRLTGSSLVLSGNAVTLDIVVKVMALMES